MSSSSSDWGNATGTSSQHRDRLDGLDQCQARAEECRHAERGRQRGLRPARPVEGDQDLVQLRPRAGTVLAGADQQHRNLQASHQPVGDASEPRPLQPAPAVGGHHHQVRADLARVIGERWSAEGPSSVAVASCDRRPAALIRAATRRRYSRSDFLSASSILVYSRTSLWSSGGGTEDLVHQGEPEARASLPGDGGRPGDRVLGEGRAVEAAGGRSGTGEARELRSASSCAPSAERGPQGAISAESRAERQAAPPA